MTLSLNTKLTRESDYSIFMGLLLTHGRVVCVCVCVLGCGGLSAHSVSGVERRFTIQRGVSGCT